MLKRFKNIPILLLAYILSIHCSFAQVTYDDNGFSGSGFSFSRDISIPEGSNRLLVVHISNLDDTPNDRSSIPSIPTASFDGQEMTQVITEGSSFGRNRSSIFIFKLGTGCELSGQISLDGGFRMIWAGSFQHVNQDNPISDQGFADIDPNMLTSSINGLTTIAGMDMLFDGIVATYEPGEAPDLTALGGNDTVLRLQASESTRIGTRARPAIGGEESVEWEVTTHTDKIHTAVVLNGVLQINSAPTALCKISYEVNLDENGTATITPTDIDNGSFDNCGGVSLSFVGGAQIHELSCSLTPQNVTLEVRDQNGNLSSCTTSVLAVDNMAPTAFCQNTVTVVLDETGSEILNAADFDNGSFDNCGDVSFTFPNGEEIFTFRCNTNVFDGYPQQLLVTDASGNTSTCTTIIDAIDEIPPVAVCKDITVQLGENGTVRITGLNVLTEYYDNCRIKSTTSPIVYTCDNIGTNIYTMTLTDISGNSGSCDAVVTVEDNIAPTAQCVTSFEVFLDDNGIAPITPTDLDNGSYDNCGEVNLSFFRGMQSIEFSCRSTVLPQEDVTLVVSDHVGNESYCTVPVVVRDTTPPVAICKDITVQLDNSGIVFVGSADVNDGSYDNCEFAISNYEFTYLCEDVGTQVITLSITDPSGNTASCNASVTVERNSNACNTTPIAVCQDITVDANENCEGTAIPTDFDGGSSDPDGDDIFFSLDNEGPYPLGVTNVSLKVIDANGVSNDCSASITVEDHTAPTAQCKSSISVVFDESGSATINAADLDDGSFDHCGDVSFSYLGGLESLTVGCQQSNINLELFVTDASGNINTCFSPVQIVDNIPPVAICQDITVQLDENGTVWVAGQDIDNGSYDNCDLRILNYTMQYSCDDLGENDYTLFVTDRAGNNASCQATLTIEDNIPPIVLTKDITVELDDNGNASITPDMVDDGSSDACGIASIDVAPSIFDCSNIGNNTVTLTVTDDHGNLATETAIVTVVEGTLIIPVATVGNDQLICGSISNTLGGNFPGEGVGQWSGPTGVTFVPDANTPNAIAQNLPIGVSTLTWTISGGICEQSSTSASLQITRANISEVIALSQTACDPWTNTYTQELQITYSGITYGDLVVNGKNFQITGSPQVVTFDNLPSNGQANDVNVFWSEGTDCVLNLAEVFTAPDDCSVPCDIISVEVGDPYNCDPNNDTYERDLTVEYQGTDLTGSFMISVDGAPTFSYPLLNQSPQVITLTDLPSNGQWVDIEIYISEASNCSWVANNLFQNPQNCGTDPEGDCDITALAAGEQRCNYENGTYEQDLILSYTNAPTNGSILLKANNQSDWTIFPISGSPQTLTLAGRTPGEGNVDIFVKFSDDNGCTFSADNLFSAPEACVLPCAITSIATGTQTTCDPSTNTYTQELVILYENEPSDGNLIVGGQVFGITGSPQMITLTNLPADGNEVDIVAYFSEDNNCQFTENNLFTAPDACTQPPSGDGNVLFVVKDASNLHSGDAAVKAQLENTGYTVVVMRDYAVQSSDAIDKDLVLVSNTVASTAVNTKFTNVEVPVVTYESQILDDLGMTGNNNGVDYGQDSNEQTMDIDDTSHPMAAGLSGEPQVFNSNGSIIWGKPNENAIKVASTQGWYDDQWAIFGYETGSSMVNGIAPARRASLFFKADQVSKLNTNGWALFDAVICWATGCQNARFAPEVNQLPPVKAYPNPFLNHLTIEWEHHAQEVYLTMRNLLGQQVFIQKVWLQGRYQLPTTHLPEGMYILQIIGDGFKQEVKVMKE